jgi:hypothetical protein
MGMTGWQALMSKASTTRVSRTQTLHMKKLLSREYFPHCSCLTIDGDGGYGAQARCTGDDAELLHTIPTYYAFEWNSLNVILAIGYGVCYSQTPYGTPHFDISVRNTELDS